MKIKHTEIEISPEQPFNNCKLSREKYAKVLTNIVESFADGFVLSINNEWGTGKTTFVKMWQQLLKNEGFRTVYFNAWENDFDNNPLVALMSELGALKNNENDKVFKSILEKGSVLLKNIAPALAKSLLNNYLLNLPDAVGDAIENATKGTTEILEGEINKYLSKKKTITEFHKELEKFISKKASSKPVVFIVDELDRCRPTYAVELLEQIKHLFSVSGIVFVLSIDKKHLSSAVKGFYGSEQIDTDEYLRRFIDLEYSIPKPSCKDFINYLFEYYSFNDFFSSDDRMRIQVFRSDSELFLLMAEFLFKKMNSTLRQQERIFAHTRLVLTSFKTDQYVFSHLLFFLIYLRNMRVEWFGQIAHKELSQQALSDFFADLICNSY